MPIAEPLILKQGPQNDILCKVIGSCLLMGRDNSK